MSEVKVFNPGDTPVLIAGPFTSVGGHEWETVQRTKEVDGLIERGLLVEVSQTDSKQEDEESGDTSLKTQTTNKKKG